ncbi:hypothetical protein MGSAQ_000797 [marine sediment metagenome]|uniref:Uncharacterized protein n=1 Tax=marine sediment metagenome TaxID=412755 RepID=A0A1B6NW81_9ZZZZ
MLFFSELSVVLTMPTGLFKAIKIKSSGSRGSISCPLTFTTSPAAT